MSERSLGRRDFVKLAAAAAKAGAVLIRFGQGGIERLEGREAAVGPARARPAGIVDEQLRVGALARGDVGQVGRPQAARRAGPRPDGHGG